MLSASVWQYYGLENRSYNPTIHGLIVSNSQVTAYSTLSPVTTPVDSVNSAFNAALLAFLRLPDGDLALGNRPGSAVKIVGHSIGLSVLMEDG